jgi:nitrate/TMAO reductase-like tetraheme cytochrome c subunit
MARYYEWMLASWRRVALRWRVTLVAVFTVAIAAVSVAGYRQWNYIQHDNRFCTSCHLMVDPFQRFSRSVHARLECHQCHEGRVPEQMHQLWLTLVEDPKTIGQHAQVPNQVCARCHIEGDSTRWIIIGATAGHRMHLESMNPKLKGMQCVQCHGVSLHEFWPVDRTCLQAGCHDRNIIRLGKMGQLSDLHCTTCHDFLAQAPGIAVDSLGQPLTPRARECLSCHRMQTEVKGLDIARDPHHGVCGDCHNPHTQSSPQDVSCTNAGCHATWREISFHKGVPHPERCTTCHVPHTWRVDGKDCLRCHANIEREAPTRSRRAAASARTNLRAPTAVADVAARDAAAGVTALLQGAVGQPGSPTLPRFSHGDHQGQACSSCHSSRVQHGQLRIRSAADCQRCHHVGPGRDRCASCHDTAALDARTLQTEQTFRLAAAREVVTRDLPFPHERHRAFVCVRCHTAPVTRASAGAECASCHASHHTAAADCAACHAGARPLAAHKVSDHTNCARAACHGARAANLPATRAMCLTCHTAQTHHEPGKVCEQCHRVLARGAT